MALYDEDDKLNPANNSTDKGAADEQGQTDGAGKSSETKTGPTLGERESSATKKDEGSKTSGGALSAGQLGSAESGINDILYKPRSGPKSLKTRIANISGRRKAFAALGAGGIVGLFLAILTTAPVFRVPSLMGSIMGFVGEQVEDVVEHRAQRMVVQYLLNKARGSTGGYVHSDSLIGSLWKTWRVNKLEERIKEQTGIELKQGPDGGVHLYHYGEDIGRVNDYNDVMAVLEDHPEAKKAFRKIYKISTKPLQRLFGAKMRKKFQQQFGTRFNAPEKDPAKTDEQNLEEFRRSQIDSVTKQNVELWGDAFDCILDDDCSRFSDSNDPVETRPNPETDTAHETADKFAKEAKEATVEAAGEAAKTGEKFQKLLIKKLVGRLSTLYASAYGGPAAAVVAAIEIIDLVYVINHAANVVYDNPELYKFPATLAAQSSGAMFAQWQGFADNIKAGRMSLLYIAALNKQMQGAEKGMAYNMTFGGDGTKGTPPPFRVESDAQYPAQTIMSYYRTYNPGYIVTNFFFENLWGPTIHNLLDFFGEKISELLAFLTGHLVEKILIEIFGEKWQERAFTWAVETITAFLAANVDGLATGADWINTVFIGGQAALNSYCTTNLGCVALTPLTNKGIFDTPLWPYNPGEFASPDDREDMAVLPLHERLFSLDEPNSLANEFFRAVPSSSSPGAWISSAFSQVAALPKNLLSTISGRSFAAGSTLEQRAAFAGIQIMGGKSADFAKDIATEVRQTTGDNPTCPKNDPQNTFNICQADKEIAQAMKCQYEDCPEYQSFEGEVNASYAANFRMLWESKQKAALLFSW